MGRLEPEKRVDVLVEAIPRVLTDAHDARFVIAGSGSAADALRALARRRSVEHAIEWKGWVREPDAVLARSHLYVNTWPWEGFGMAMAEAMAWGLPVVATDSAASPELVADEQTGLIVPPCDPAALADAIIRLLRDRELAARMGALGRTRAERYGIRTTAEQTLALYSELIQRRAR